jgi:hypothetical protein
MHTLAASCQWHGASDRYGLLGGVAVALPAAGHPVADDSAGGAHGGVVEGHGAVEAGESAVDVGGRQALGCDEMGQQVSEQADEERGEPIPASRAGGHGGVGDGRSAEGCDEDGGHGLLLGLGLGDEHDAQGGDHELGGEAGDFGGEIRAFAFAQGGGFAVAEFSGGIKHAKDPPGSADHQREEKKLGEESEEDLVRAEQGEGRENGVARLAAAGGEGGEAEGGGEEAGVEADHAGDGGADQDADGHDHGDDDEGEDDGAADENAGLGAGIGGDVEGFGGPPEGGEAEDRAGEQEEAGTLVGVEEVHCGWMVELRTELFPNRRD